MIIGAPKWMETDRYDIVAKAPTDVSMDALKAMMRSLFVERFQLKTHTEDRPVPVYVMTVGKRGSKLEKASDDARGGCKRSADNGQLVLTCKSMTMAQFADQIRRSAGGYFDHKLVDETELTGAYDFTVSWTARRRLGGAGGRGGDAPSPQATVGAASDPTGGLTVFEAIDRQLGLKVELQKRPMPGVVIDHATPLVAEK